MTESGIFITTIAGKTAVVTVHEVYDGGMVEFFDAVTQEPRGCAGIHWWNETSHKVRYDGSLPTIPDSKRWI